MLVNLFLRFFLRFSKIGLNDFEAQEFRRSFMLFDIILLLEIFCKCFTFKINQVFCNVYCWVVVILCLNVLVFHRRQRWWLRSPHPFLGKSPTPPLHRSVRRSLLFYLYLLVHLSSISLRDFGFFSANIYF